MPKITTYHYKQFKVIVSYSLKTSSFTIVLPDEMNQYSISGTSISAHTLKEVEAEFRRIVELFVKEGAERIKYIALYAENFSRMEDDFTRAKGHEGFLNIKYAIVTRITINGEYQYRYSKHCDRPSLESSFWKHDDVKFIEWTEKREAYLKRTIDAINEMSEKVKSFFESDTVVELIDNNKGVLQIEGK